MTKARTTSANEVTAKGTVEQLKQLFNRIKDVYFNDTPIASVADLTEVIPLPVGSDGVNFDAGDPDITKYKLTTGAIWTAIADAGDADISFQVPSIADYIAEKFQNKVTSEKQSLTFEGETYEGNGFNFEPKKVVGAMMMRSQDRQTIIVLPNIEGYATPKLDDTGKPLYYNLSISPMNNSAGVGIYYLIKKEDEGNGDTGEVTSPGTDESV